MNSIPNANSRGEVRKLRQPTKVDPYSLPAEEAVLGAILLSGEALIAVTGTGIRPADFHKAAHQHIYAAIVALHARAAPADTVSVSDELQRVGLLDASGGLEALHALQNATPSITNAGYHAGIVQKHARWRHLQFAAADLAEAIGAQDDVGRDRALEAITTAARAGPVSTAGSDIELIDWSTIHDRPDEIVDGLIFPGRWTAMAAPAKAGKSTLLLAITTEISNGRDPYTGASIEPVKVLYLDAEMGRHDLEDRLRNDHGYTDPVEQLPNWLASDMVPKMVDPNGANRLLNTVERLGAQVVVIDGFNGVVVGPEKDDTTWRPFFELCVVPLKRMGVAVVTGDNLGKDKGLGPRGSSVKVDKPDGVLLLTRTDTGVKLHAEHRRTSAYPLERLLAVDGIDSGRPVRYRITGASWPTGTLAAVELLARLGVPVEHGRNLCRKALIAAGETMSDQVLNAAIRWRKTNPPSPPGDRP